MADEFPGPVVIASTPPPGTIPLCGGEHSDGHPWALQVTYATTAGDVLRVRTVRGTIDWPQTIRSVEELATNLSSPGSHGRQSERDLSALETPTTIMIDDSSIPATRINLPSGDRSGVQIDWQDQRVFCIGDPRVIDDLELRSATRGDFERFTADFADYVARRRDGQSG
jgi:hypothetical protein